MITPAQSISQTLAAATEELLAGRTFSGHWAGELSDSALSTATAIVALDGVDRRAHRELIRSGLGWLAANQNEDGGWGDTVRSRSNISTTTLCWAALSLADGAEPDYAGTTAAAEAWLSSAAGGLDAESLAMAIGGRYGNDRTFSAPILTMCAITGRLGSGRDAWRHVVALPFELAACPRRLLKWLRMPVVSYALPALIAIGAARYRHRPPLNPITRSLRWLTKARALRVLRNIQPESGGYLEATPLTSFVVMSLASCGLAECEVARRGVAFLARSARDNGSWPIDTNLATWLTTLSVDALAANGDIASNLSCDERRQILDWLLEQQHRELHPYTQAKPGGWAWTDLSGGVPDADDTAGALVALRHLAADDVRVRQAAAEGVNWLLDMQNRDGGVPTFCKGWGLLPFDRSAPDLTAHALRAWLAWQDDLPQETRIRIDTAVARAVGYLCDSQAADGSWAPLWFGNQFSPQDENRTYGTARVVAALCEMAGRGRELPGGMLPNGVKWLVCAQNIDGGWGGGPEIASSIEETALAADALARLLAAEGRDDLLDGSLSREAVEEAVGRGTSWLTDKTQMGTRTAASPIGFYFAKLWYFERLYPMIFTVGALGRAERLLRRDAAGYCVHCGRVEV